MTDGGEKISRVRRFVRRHRTSAGTKCRAVVPDKGHFSSSCHAGRNEKGPAPRSEIKPPRVERAERCGQRIPTTDLVSLSLRGTSRQSSMTRQADVYLGRG